MLGDPAHDVRRILLAVDPVTAVADEAILMDADLLVTHHPLFLKGVHGFAATDPKGRVAHRLTSNGCALFAAHTNADSPAGGVSESLALALGLEDVRPLEADPTPPLDKIVVFVPVDAAERVRAALADAGAGRVGDYDQASFTTPGRRTVPAARGCAPGDRRGRAGRGRRGGAHRDGVPAQPAWCGGRGDAGGTPLRGAGVRRRSSWPRWTSPTVARAASGDWPTPMTLRDFAAHVDRRAGRRRLTACASRATRTSRCETVGLCGGAGDFLLDRARSAGVDVYLTSDLRHHPASELREHGTPGTRRRGALGGGEHLAAGAPGPAGRGTERSGLGDTVEVRVSATNTDPWTFRV